MPIILEPTVYYRLIKAIHHSRLWFIVILSMGVVTTRQKRRIWIRYGERYVPANSERSISALRAGCERWRERGMPRRRRREVQVVPLMFCEEQAWGTGPNRSRLRCKSAHARRCVCRTTFSGLSDWGDIDHPTGTILATLKCMFSVMCPRRRASSRHN